MVFVVVVVAIVVLPVVTVVLVQQAATAASTQIQAPQLVPEILLFSHLPKLHQTPRWHNIGVTRSRGARHRGR